MAPSHTRQVISWLVTVLHLLWTVLEGTHFATARQAAGTNVASSNEVGAVATATTSTAALASADVPLIR